MLKRTRGIEYNVSPKIYWPGKNHLLSFLTSSFEIWGQKRSRPKNLLGQFFNQSKNPKIVLLKKCNLTIPKEKSNF